MFVGPKEFRRCIAPMRRSLECPNSPLSSAPPAHDAAVPIVAWAKNPPGIAIDAILAKFFIFKSINEVFRPGEVSAASLIDDSSAAAIRLSIGVAPRMPRPSRDPMEAEGS